MMVVVVAVLITTFLTGACIGMFLKLSLAIGREDRKHSLRCDAPSQSAQAARDLVGISSARWE